MFRKITIFFMALCLLTLMAMPMGVQAAETLPAVGAESVSGNDIGELESPETGEETQPGENGWLRLTKADEDTGEPLHGASFKICHASDGTEAGELETGDNGIAQASLDPGEYYLLEQYAPEGYQLSGEKYKIMVSAGETQDIIITNKRLPGQEPESEIGTIKITITDSDRKDKKLSGAVFSVYEAGSGKKVGELLIKEDGSASLELPAGSYTIKETVAPKGYCLPDETFQISLQIGGVEELSVTNHKEETKEEPGALRITKRDMDNGKRLKDAVFGIYDEDTDNRMGEVTTDRKGVAEIELDAGSYYLLELEAPAGYHLDEEKVSFTICSGQTTEKTIKNEIEESEETGEKEAKADTVKEPAVQASLSPSPSESLSGNMEDKTDQNNSGKKTGTLRVINSASGTGEKLSGQMLAVYDSNGKKAGELMVKDGKGTLSLPEGDYYLREKKSPTGFYGETARIRFSITEGLETVVEINSERDLEHTNPQDIIPKTGETIPLLPLGLSTVFFIAAVLCGIFLCRMELNKH